MDIPQLVLGNLTDTDKQEYEIWQELLNSRGFRLLRDFLQESSESNDNNIHNANNWDAYVFARGKRDGLGLVINLESILEAKIEQIAEDLENAVEPEPSYDPVEVNLGINQ